ncbi:MAG: Oxygen-sensitive ribonucleoside-triphosphate reductase-like protein [candidate division TM6 bacterium GW2011_GWF2_30_66]|jgi:ribonucleoside-triphosphate reductase|nr:MAG: Oxygen-sensitive ribonucleoside-triphosphate reductase-like protein [candidate division TM6 bacterium GW2011_GWF2_30_66]
MEMLNGFSAFSDSFKKLYSGINKELLKIEGISPEQLDISALSERYFKESVLDMTVDGNANYGQDSRSYGNYLSEMTKSHIKLIGYHDIYKILESKYDLETADKALKFIIEGDLYMHDSTSLQVPYCWAMSVDFLLSRGNYWGQLRSYPPKRKRSFMDQVKEVVIEMSQEIAGAVAIGDLIVCYSYFVKKENLDLTDPIVVKDIENDFQSLVHTLNKKLRSSHQSPFTNISIFDMPNLEFLFGDYIFPDLSKPDFNVVWEIQKIFCNWFQKGDPASGFPYRFPVVTLNLRVDENENILDQRALEYFSEINLEKGCFNIYISSGNKIAMCCRFVNDLDLAGTDSFGNGGLSIGSHRVVTVNLARLGYLANSYDHLIELLHDRLDTAAKALLAHKQLLRNRVDANFLPFVQRGIISLDRLFSTFGINGISECLEQMGYSILTQSGKEMSKSILDDIRRYAAECTKKYDSNFNVEQVPAESLAVHLAKKDAIAYGMDYEIYSNQFVPLWVDCDVANRIEIDGIFSKVLTGGGISHLNIGEKLTHKDQMKKLIAYSIKVGCEHFAINYNFCKCQNDHTTIAGPSTVCPMCGAPIVGQYTRVIGYFTPVSSWNRGRQKEHTKRVFKESPFKKSAEKESVEQEVFLETIDKDNNQAQK